MIHDFNRFDGKEIKLIMKFYLYINKIKFLIVTNINLGHNYFFTIFLHVIDYFLLIICLSIAYEKYNETKISFNPILQ